MRDSFESGGPVAPAPRWYVMFCGEEKRKHLIDYISPKAFLHCCAFFFDASGDRWLIYDVNRGGVAIVALRSHEFDQWLTYMRRNGARVLAVDWQPAIRAPLQIGMWCVSAVRYAIGAKSLAIRPIGLWRDLLKAGAKEVFV